MVTRIARRRVRGSVVRVKLVKLQTNGTERRVVKEDATEDDLRVEAARLRAELGYDVQPDGRRGSYVVSHPFYRGRYVLTLEPE